MSGELPPISEGDDRGRSLVSNRAMEIATALVVAGVAGLVMFSNYRLGAGWDSNGPETGYFPFYVGAIMLVAAIAILARVLFQGGVAAAGSFVESRSLGRVLQILISTMVFVVAITFIGIYVATALFISVFMVWLGCYRIPTAALIGMAVAVALFFTFEVWFLVPLPKGPLETWLGY